MATRKSTPSAEKKTTTRKAPAGNTAQAATKSAAQNSAETLVARRTPTYEEIARLAEQFWIERGRPNGSPEVDWLRAEQTLFAA